MVDTCPVPFNVTQSDFGKLFIFDSTCGTICFSKSSAFDSCGANAHVDMPSDVITIFHKYLTQRISYQENVTTHNRIQRIEAIDIETGELQRIPINCPLQSLGISYSKYVTQSFSRESTNFVVVRLVCKNRLATDFPIVNV